MSDADELLKYKKLLEDGAITQQEFDAKKEEIINSGSENESKEENSNGCLTGCVGVLGVIIMLYIGGFIGFSGTDTTPEEKAKNEISEAEYYASKEIKKVLKSPSTAKVLENPVVIDLGGHKYSVTGEVDAKNTLGAILRKRWNCKMDFSGGSNSYTADCAVLE